MPYGSIQRTIKTFFFFFAVSWHHESLLLEDAVHDQNLAMLGGVGTHQSVILNINQHWVLLHVQIISVY